MESGNIQVYFAFPFPNFPFPNFFLIDEIDLGQVYAASENHIALKVI